MYAKIATLLPVAASAQACARDDQLARRELRSETSVKGPGCAIDIAESRGRVPGPSPGAESRGQVPEDRPPARDEPEDRPADPRGDDGDNPNGGSGQPERPTTEPGGPLGPAGV